MSSRHRVERGALTFSAIALAVVCAGFVVASAGGASETWLLVSLWGTGLASLLCAFAACRVAPDAGDNPEYFASLGRGLRQEWRRENSSP
jgi:anaerobic C4-dicarboxylate transporter